MKQELSDLLLSCGIATVTTLVYVLIAIAVYYTSDYLQRLCKRHKISQLVRRIRTLGKGRQISDPFVLWAYFCIISTDSYDEFIEAQADMRSHDFGEAEKDEFTDALQAIAHMKISEKDLYKIKRYKLHIS